jgi:hypothetical protein
MPSTLFDSAGLAVVAYAQVNGATGASENTSGLANSGVYTTKLSPGLYLVQMSTALGQDPSRDLIFVQPTTKSTPTVRPSVIVVDVDDYNKQVSLGDAIGTTAIDCNFDVLVLRTILP